MDVRRLRTAKEKYELPRNRKCPAPGELAPRKEQGGEQGGLNVLIEIQLIPGNT